MTAYVAPERIEPRVVTEAEREALSAAAQDAVSAYSLTVSSIELVAVHSNAVFFVRSKDGDRYILRVGMPVGEFDSDTLTEVTWLLAVRAGTDVAVVEPIATSDGRMWSEVLLPGESGARKCLLFRYVAGVPLTECISEENYRRLGEVSATLHDFAATWLAPDGLRPMVWDRVFYLPGEDCCLFDEANSQIVTEHQRKMLVPAIEAAEASLAEASAAGVFYVHGDLHMRNVLVDGSAMTVLDFEDVMIANPGQDVAVSLHYGRARSDYGLLVRAFREGYESLRSWPVTDPWTLEAFMAARSIMQLNHALVQGWDASAFAQRVSLSLKKFLNMVT